MTEIKKSVQEAGHKVAETATKAGLKISEAVEKAADWVKEKAHELGHGTEEPTRQVHCEETASTEISEHMEVYSSCGCRIGKVDRVEGDTIKLTKDDPLAAGRHHTIPMEWVESVDDKVHLNKNAADAMGEWHTEPAEMA